MSRKNSKIIAPAVPASDDAPASDAPAVNAAPLPDAPATVTAPTPDATPDATPAEPNPADRRLIPALRGEPGTVSLFTYCGAALNVHPARTDSLASDSVAAEPLSIAARLSLVTDIRSDVPRALRHAARLIAYGYTYGPPSLGPVPSDLPDPDAAADAADVPFARTRGAHFNTTRVSDLDRAACAFRAAARLMYTVGVRFTPAGNLGTRAGIPAYGAALRSALAAALAASATPAPATPPAAP